MGLGLGSDADFCREGGVSPHSPQSPGSILAFLCGSSSPGVAYTSECFPCKPGTYADQQGSSSCKLCPANFYSNKGETSCHQCDPDKYSGEGRKSLVFQERWGRGGGGVGGRGVRGGVGWGGGRYQHIYRDEQEVEPRFQPS